MRIVLVEVREKGSVRKMLKTRGVVTHDIIRTRNVEAGEAVAVEALMGSGQRAEVGWSLVAGDSTTAQTREGRRVVSARAQSGIANVVLLSHDGCLTEGSSVFEITVGDVPTGIVSGDETGLDVSRVGLTPEEGRTRRVEVDPTHACLRGVSCTEKGRILGHNLGQMCRATAKTGGELGESSDVVTETVGDANASMAGPVEG